VKAIRHRIIAPQHPQLPKTVVFGEKFGSRRVKSASKKKKKINSDDKKKYEN
jgi:hypothetical protein